MAESSFAHFNILLVPRLSRALPKGSSAWWRREVDRLAKWTYARAPNVEVLAHATRLLHLPVVWLEARARWG
ncbi:hypothetical protein B0H13DRAFT_2380196 [Mycena leptocephala]|nr:hypothetical protein B0H13DRAFT_2380196 [Mycena leptocephala]